ncbi:hypothetical protein [Paraburkholderia fynbosensis]|uniref:Uncharacterized protein n=1 Tax=Paraburkholderia fynbosensis TaxID=1200993 RepID=A0A6J5FVQ1_9BURK|nr:hypothetical protein [Paraburkholderia fynbosensis]CAB3788068.1 hypothetical protein LMG27177_02320 [Paraburkholderia fynbosensis]
MKIVTGSMAVTLVALLVGIAGAADAQQSGNTSAGMSGTQSSGANTTGAAAAGMGTGTGTGLSPTPGVGMSAGVTSRSSSGPALNNMRANGTSLDMNPDPRAPNVTGKAAPRR